MVNNPQIICALRKKETEFTFISDTEEPRRSVFYFCDVCDEKATAYSDKLADQEFGKAVPIILSEENTLEGWIRDYIECMKTSRNPNVHRVYCLFISSDAKRYNARILLDASSAFVELYYQLLYLGCEVPKDTPNNYFGASWIVNPEDVLVAKILLADASFSYEWISPGNWGFEIGGGWYRICADRYSSVGDDICGQLYHKMSPMFKNEDESELDRKMYEFYKAMYDHIKQIYIECPNVRFLPLVGYKDLCTILFGEKSRTLLGKPISGVLSVIYGGATKFKGKVQVREAAQILFGIEEAAPRSEWIRGQVVTEYLPEACLWSVKTYENEIRDQLFQRFTLDDLYGKVAEISLRYTRQQLERCNKIERDIESVLNDRYVVKTGDLVDIWKGFGRYFYNWDQFIQQHVIGAWWRAIAQFVIQLSKECNEDYRKLRQAYNDFEDYKDMAQNADIPIRSIRSFSDLLHAIDLSSAVTCYTPEMLRSLRRRALALHVETGDSTSSEKKPKIGLLISDKLVDDADTEPIFDEFEWRYHPRRYLPKNIIYELRVYKERKL